jgi:hypothetical protein
MVRVVLLACAMSTALAAHVAGAGRQAEEGKVPLPSRIQLQNVILRGSLVRALAGAGQRLNRPACQKVFGDFSDESGASLLARLQSSGQSARQYLVEQLLFVEGENAPLCRRDASTAAFTSPGSVVVHVCPVFAELATRDSTAAEVVLIHELLHALGLGENPPSSRDITKRVTVRCGGS